MKLNNRLKIIAEKIPECDILADIGTDHGYIPIYAVKNHLCRKALAADLRPGPLKMAQRNIIRYGLEDQIEIRLGNGLEPIEYSESDIIVISGMGGQLIRDILSRSFEKAVHAKLLLLQPNNAVNALRKWIYENGFDIVDETLVLDSGKIYCLINCKWTGNKTSKDEFIYYIGEKLLTSNDPLLKSYLNKKLKELEVITEGRGRANPDKGRKSTGTYEIDTETCIFIRDRLKDELDRILKNGGKLLW